MRTKTWGKLLLFISIALIFIPACESKSKIKGERLEIQKNSLNSHIGEEFQIENILDTAGKIIKLDFTKSEITIIDFWFNGCPPCIKEMKQFAEILLGKDKKISVISISINRFSVWKKTLIEHTGRFAFLSESVRNWKHYNLQSMEDEKLKNDVPADNQDKIEKIFNVTFFPAFFVVDKDGIIKSRPVSAVDFIKQNLY